jgi:hypothetical protein
VFELKFSVIKLGKNILLIYLFDKSHCPPATKLETEASKSFINGQESIAKYAKPIYSDKLFSFLGNQANPLITTYSPESSRHWFSLIEGRKLYWVGVREKRSQYKLRRK